MSRALWVGGLCLTIGGCSSTHDANPGADGGGATATSGTSLAGTWDLMTTAVGDDNALPTTVTIGQDSLTVTTPTFFTLTATRTASTLTFTDQQTPDEPENDVILAATQKPGSFSTGVLPFELSGSWTMTIGPTGGSPVMTCTLTVTTTEIDGACQKVADQGFDLAFTTTKMKSESSSLGDFGGTWLNKWVGAGSDGGIETFPCMLEFTGNTITTCPGTVVDQELTGSPITGITFTYDGANTISGTAQGWAEYSATRR